MSDTSKPEAPGSSSAPRTQDLKDLGFGSRVLERSQSRFLNRDGTFNVVRLGLPWWRSLNLYHTLVSCRWPTFYGLLALAYLVTNLAFALAYLACGPGALAGSTSITLPERFFDAFFFSVQTLATIGYGALSPRGLAANVLVAVEALMGLLGVALATGLSFARFARPQARIRFADKAVVAPYGEGTGFMFRLVNEQSAQLVDVDATVVFSFLDPALTGRAARKFVPLELERSRVVFFPLHWTVVHPITAQSPLAGFDAESLSRSQAEVFILLTAFDEASSQTVHARTSYRTEEIVFGARYRDIFVGSGDQATIDISRLGEVVPI
ncbi:MAG: transporter [Vicinamibacteria bacterium]|nr:transporter [Vicinamibacteria bacterium]